MKNKDIIIFSAIDWDTQWQWQQELAIHFAKKIEFYLLRIQVFDL